MKLNLYADGGARGNPGPAAIGAVLKNKEGQIVGEVSRFIDKATNNQAEYAAVIFGSEKALELGVSDLKIFLDSKLVVEQICGRWKIKDLRLKKAAEKVHAILGKIDKWEIAHISREKNHEADKLVNQVLDSRGFKKSNFKLPAWSSFR